MHYSALPLVQRIVKAYERKELERERAAKKQKRNKNPHERD